MHSLAICSMANNAFFQEVVRGICREVSTERDVRLLSWQGNHLIPPAALAYLSPDALVLGALPLKEMNALPGALPKLCFSNARESLPWPRVVNDDVQVGELAAQALIDAGYSQVRIFGDTRTHHCALRCKGAKAALHAAGVPSKRFDSTLPPPRPGKSFAEIWEARCCALRRFLADCPTNTGLLVLEGNLACEIRHLLREEVKRSVPDDLGLLVADLVLPENEDLAHVMLNGEEIGRRCVQTLLRHLHNCGDAFPAVHTVPARGVLPGSTLREEDTQILYQRLEAWVHKHLREPVTVEDAAAHLGLSRRSLEMKLHAKGFPAPYELITGIRLREARLLLESGDMRMGDIAEATGFRSARALTNRFRAHHGVPPREWRKTQGHKAS